MLSSILIYCLYALVIGIPLLFYWRALKKREVRAREATKKGAQFSEGPRAQHPHIDVTHCIGCQSCTTVCPEGDVLAMVGGKAVLVNGHKCIGHGLCAEACPVGAITLVMASPNMSADLPFLTAEYETSVPNLHIAGELGGLALIKNAINQGRSCIDTIAARVESLGPARVIPGVYDVLIIGAGPAGISASLRAIEKKLNYLTLERDEIGGTVTKYPRQKLVLTSPVQFPLYGEFKKLQLSKEELLAFWKEILNRADFRIRTGESVEDIRKDAQGLFEVATNRGRYRAHAVVLAIGRTGTPRKLGVQGEELPKVMYRLIEADHYVNKRILVVGGGDSAVEAAMGLAQQKGNQVTLSYRKDSFSRIKERNAQRIEEARRAGKVKVIFNSIPAEVRPESVILEINGQRQEMANDFVWIFAGGVPPNDFLKKIGVEFGSCDITVEASSAAREARPRA